MNRFCYGVFLAATILFAFGVWTYEWLSWPDHPIFFSLASPLLFCSAVFLLWAGRKQERWRIVLAAVVCFCYWLLSVIPLIQKTGWGGSAKTEVSVRVLDAKTGKAIPGASVRMETEFEKLESKTDRNGKARMEAWLWASGSSSLYHHQGRVRLLGLSVNVEMNDYKPGSFSFDENNGSWPLYGPPIPEIEIRLQKK